MRWFGGGNPAMEYELIWGRQWLPHTWKPHVITVVHLSNPPVLNSMINSCKQYWIRKCLCDNVYSYLIFVLYFIVSWSKGWHCVLSPGKCDWWQKKQMTVAAIIYLFLLRDITEQNRKVFWRKATFLPVTFTLSSTNVVIQSQLTWTEAKV